MQNNDEGNLARLRWQCRRGMLELDLVLGAFLEKKYPDLLVADQHLFVELLACQDQDLYVWIIGKQPPLDPKFSKLIGAIQHATL